MSNVIINENERFNANQITLSKNNNLNKNVKTVTKMGKNGEDEDGQQNILNEDNTSMKKNSKNLEDGTDSDLRLSWRDLYPQVLASCISLLVVIQPGINLAYSNNLLHHMPSLNNGQFSWITSILALCIPIGAFLIGLIMDRIGRKYACLLACLPLLASWVTVAITSSENIYTFYISRMFAGIGTGMTTVGIVYVSEISHTSYKQLLLSLNSVFFSGGVLLATCITRLDWNIINYTFIAFTVINMALIVVYLPESPVWILKFKSSEYTSKAKAAVKQIYPNNVQVYKAEWKRLKVTATPNCNANGEAIADEPPSFFKSIRSSPTVYKPMVILATLLLLQQLTGAYPTISYALPILKSIVADSDTINEIESLAVLGTIRFVSGLLACMLSFYFGRKPLLIFSCVGMAVSSALVTCTYDATPQPLPNSHSVEILEIPLSLCGVMLYVFFSSLGVLVFPWTLICELLPTSVRAIGGCLLVSYCYLVMFVVLKVFPHFLSTLTVPNVFLVFGTVSLAMATYVNFIVPETLGKDFQEIEEYFSRQNNKKIRSHTY